MNWGQAERLISAAAGSLGWFAGVCYACMLTLTLLKKSKPEFAKRWQDWNEGLKKFRERGRTRLEWVWVLGLTFVMSAVLVYAATRPPEFPIVEEHNVAVIGQLDNGDWMMRSDEEGEFAYRPCDDFNANGMLSQGVGYIASRARWEERGVCKSIRATGMGFWWRDEHDQYRRIQ